MSAMAYAIRLVERGLVPDIISKYGIRRLLKQRLRSEDQGSLEANRESKNHFVNWLKESKVAAHTDVANKQHYELPARFFELVLGNRLKYSGCYWPEGVSNLDQAEEAMLELTCRRAALEDGQEILELGCGWGSLTLKMAELYPSSRIYAMSNSSPQREFILNQAATRGLGNIQVETCDINDFRSSNRFDRVVSVEMFEHVRNYEQLMTRITGWLNPGGRLFIHVFCHRVFAYAFETEGAGNWMGRHFFTGGIMPSFDLLPQFKGAFELEESWEVNGNHYANTARSWIQNLDANKAEVETLFSEVYGPDQVTRWYTRWKLFFMACEELFGYRDGREWLIAHYRFASVR